MNPSLDDRIASMIRAMADVIMPALDPNNSLAREQAGLMVGHLQVLRQHVNDAARFEAVELERMEELANRLLGAASGGAQTLSAIDGLRMALDTPGPGSSAGITRLRSIGMAIDRLIGSSRLDADQDSRAAISALILQHGRHAALLNRVWFAGMGFEAADAGLPPMSEMLVKAGTGTMSSSEPR